MQTYLTFSVGGAEELRRLGATDVRLDVRDLDTWPTIELLFDRPGGNLSGLRFLDISFAGTSVEALTAGTTSVDGRIHL